MRDTPVLADRIVLIDTWWNVNVTEAGLCNAMNFVLIDTWWNVNYDVYEIEELATGFNRYMVECEFFLNVVTTGSAVVLIDTWWNVNRI